jgi:Carbohydrate-binding module 48 (Isoamylase N-terminal domain)
MDEKRLRRWLDRELTEAEADAFLGSLGETERLEARALSAVSEAAALLPSAGPSEDFAARAMARVRARRPPRRSVWTWLRSPALSPLTALAGAAAIAIGVFGLAAWQHRAGARVAPVVSRSAAPEVVARLAYRAPLAREVAVAGDFNGWNPQTAHMHRGQGGVWSVEIPVSPGRRYQYMFVVDGRWVTDPTAPASVDDGFGGRNAVLDL